MTPIYVVSAQHTTYNFPLVPLHHPEIPGGGAYFGTYYWLVNSLRSAGTDRGELSISRTLFAGGMAGIMNWLVMLPMDVAKSRYQIAPEGQYRGLYAVYAELVSMYVGMYTRAYIEM